MSWKVSNLYCATYSSLSLRHNNLIERVKKPPNRVFKDLKGTRISWDVVAFCSVGERVEPPTPKVTKIEEWTSDFSPEKYVTGSLTMGLRG